MQRKDCEEIRREGEYAVLAPPKASRKPLVFGRQVRAKVCSYRCTTNEPGQAVRAQVGESHAPVTQAAPMCSAPRPATALSSKQSPK